MSYLDVVRIKLILSICQVLLGQGNREIPQRLVHVIQIHSNLPYPEFYSLLHSMDLLIPAFRGEGYYTDCGLFFDSKHLLELKETHQF